MKARVSMAAAFMLCVSLGVSATQVHSEVEHEKGSVRSESGVFEEDYLYLGNELRFSGEVEDLVFLGKKLAFDGKARQGLIALGQKVTARGEVGNGIIAGCQDLTIDRPVAGTNFVGCQSFHLTESAAIDGDLFLGCAKATFDGPVRGDLYLGAGEVVINSVVEGDVAAYTGRIVFGENGRVNGDLTYAAKEPLSDEQRQRVGGSVVMKEHDTFSHGDEFKDVLKVIGWVFGIAMFISSAVVGLLLLLLPAFRNLEQERSGRAFCNTALWGLIPLLMYPAIVILSFVLVVTIPFGIVLLLAGVPLLFLAYIIGATLTGQYLVKRFKWDVRKRHYHFLIGLLAAAILSIIPFVDFLVFMFVSALGFGVYLSYLFKKDFTAEAAPTATIASGDND